MVTSQRIGKIMETSQKDKMTNRQMGIALLAGLFVGFLGCSLLYSGLWSGRFEVESMLGFIYFILATGGFSVIVGVAMQLILDG